MAAKVYQIAFKRASKSEIYEKFKSRYSEYNLAFLPRDVPVLRAYVKSISPDLSDGIERAGSSRIMFRNFGLNFLLLFIVLVAQGISTTFSVILITAIICCISLLLLAFNEHKKWDTWFFLTTYESVLAIALKDAKLAQKGNLAQRTPEAQNLLNVLLLSSTDTNLEHTTFKTKVK